MEETLVIARPAAVTFEDITQFVDMTKPAFFGIDRLKTFTVFGLTIQDDKYTKVLFHDDNNDDTECEGIIIPNSCVIEINYLNYQITDFKGAN